VRRGVLLFRLFGRARGARRGACGARTSSLHYAGARAWEARGLPQSPELPRPGARPTSRRDFPRPLPHARTPALHRTAQTGVVVGAIAGHGLATGIAVAGGGLLSKYISERTAQYIGGSLFLVFAAATVFDIATGAHG
jgi:hypothetical protein